jgi:hypothetical protein
MDGSPDAILSEQTPFQKWLSRKNPELPYNVMIFAKYGEGARDRLVLEHGAVPAVFHPASQSTFYLLSDGRFAVITSIMDNIDQMVPQMDVWNWWDEGMPDLATMREKTNLDEKISANRFV